VAIAKNTGHASRLSVLSGVETHNITRVAYGVHTPKEQYKPRTLKVSYYADSIAEPVAVEFLSFEHNANPTAKRKAIQWLKQIPWMGSDGKQLETTEDNISIDGKEIKTVLELVPFTKLLTPPKTIGTMPSSHNAKYRTIISRSFT